MSDLEQNGSFLNEIKSLINQTSINYEEQKSMTTTYRFKTSIRIILFDQTQVSIFENKMNEMMTKYFTNQDQTVSTSRRTELVYIRNLRLIILERTDFSTCKNAKISSSFRSELTRHLDETKISLLESIPNMLSNFLNISKKTNNNNNDLIPQQTFLPTIGKQEERKKISSNTFQIVGSKNSFDEKVFETSNLVSIHLNQNRDKKETNPTNEIQVIENRNTLVESKQTESEKQKEIIIIGDTDTDVTDSESEDEISNLIKKKHKTIEINEKEQTKNEIEIKQEKYPIYKPLSPRKVKNVNNNNNENNKNISEDEEEYHKDEEYQEKKNVKKRKEPQKKRKEKESTYNGIIFEKYGIWFYQRYFWTKFKTMEEAQAFEKTITPKILPYRKSLTKSFGSIFKNGNWWRFRISVSGNYKTEQDAQKGKIEIDNHLEPFFIQKK